MSLNTYSGVMQSSGRSAIPVELSLAMQNESSKAIRCSILVAEENLFPTLLLGSRISLEQVALFSPIEDNGIYYIVDGNLDGIIRRLSTSASEDYLRASSDHNDKEQWPDQFIPFASIRALFKVIPSF